MDVVGILLILLVAACVAMLWSGGLWSNAITFFNVLFSAIIATNYYEPLAGWFQKKAASWSNEADLVALWLVFALSMAIMRGVTDTISRTRVKFRKPLEFVGGIVFALATAWVMICFAGMSFHMAPLSRNFLWGTFQEEPQSRMMYEVAPDRKWLGFMYTMTHGGALQASYVEKDPERYGFDSKGDFIVRYGYRRDALEKEVAKRIKEGK